MKFLATISRGYSRRAVEIDAPNAAAARAIAERQCGDGESISPAAHAVMLYAQRTVDPSPTMPADHARNVVLGRKS